MTSALKIFRLGGGSELAGMADKRTAYSPFPGRVSTHSLGWVMAAGYAFGPFMLMKPEERKRITLRWGLILIVTFIVLRAINGYGDPDHGSCRKRNFLPYFLS